MPRLSEVFVQNAQPVHTYVNRKFIDPRTQKARDPELEIGRVLNSQGAIVQVVGPSKSGKSVAIRRRFQEAHVVKVSASQLSDPERLWALVCASLRIEVSHKQSRDTKKSETDSTTATAKGGIYAAEFGLTKAAAVTQESTAKREGTFLDNLYELAVQGLIAQNKVLLIDDFHVAPEKTLLAASLKQASEDGVRICLAAVSHRADDPQLSLSDLSGRVTRIEFGTWQQEDLTEIAEKGFLALGLKIPASTTLALVMEAGGSPQLMQLLCLELCRHFDIEATEDPPKSVPVTLPDITIACVNALASVPGESVLLALEQGSSSDRSTRTRWTTKAATTVDLYEACLCALAMNPPRAKIPLDSGDDNIMVRLRNILGDQLNAVTIDEIIFVLDDMANSASRTSPTLPAFHFERLRGASILDPYFQFYARWCVKYFELRTATQ